MAFCPKCGKKGITTTFCSDCVKSEIDLSFKEVHMKVCAMCRTYESKNKFVPFDDLGDALVEFARTKIKNPGNMPVELHPIFPKVIHQNPGVNVLAEIEVVTPEAKFTIPAKVEFTLCKKCGKSGSSYFEGVLQLRDVNQEVFDFVYKFVKNNEPNVFITKEVPTKYGFDLYFSSQKYLNMLGKKLKSQFGGEMRTSARLFTRNKQTSKEVFRVTVFFKLRKYKIGDIIEYKGMQVKITALGRRVQGSDVTTGKKMFVE